MIPLVPFAEFPGKTFYMPVFHQVEFATDNRLEFSLVGFIDKLKGPIHIAMVGECDSLVPVSHCFIHQGFDPGCSVEQRVLGMTMQVNKIRHVLAGYVAVNKSKGSPDLTS